MLYIKYLGYLPEAFYTKIAIVYICAFIGSILGVTIYSLLIRRKSTRNYSVITSIDGGEQERIRNNYLWCVWGWWVFGFVEGVLTGIAAVTPPGITTTSDTPRLLVAMLIGAVLITIFVIRQPQSISNDSDTPPKDLFREALLAIAISLVVGTLFWCFLPEFMILLSICLGGGFEKLDTTFMTVLIAYTSITYGWIFILVVSTCAFWVYIMGQKVNLLSNLIISMFIIGLCIIMFGFHFVLPIGFVVQP